MRLPRKQTQLLEDLLDRLIESALSASDAIDKALLFVEASNLRIETMEKGSKQ